LIGLALGVWKRGGIRRVGQRAFELRRVQLGRPAFGLIERIAICVQNQDQHGIVRLPAEDKREVFLKPVEIPALREPTGLAAADRADPGIEAIHFLVAENDQSGPAERDHHDPGDGGGKQGDLEAKGRPFHGSLIRR